jgi:hypothetical protein
LCFQHVERGELEVSDPAGEAFTRLLEQIKGGGTEQKVLPSPASIAARLVNQTTQDGEKPWCAMDLVQNHQLVLVIRKIELGLAQLGAILLGFKVDVMRVETPPYVQRQRRLAHLSRTQQPHRRVILDGIDQLWKKTTLYHPSNYGL